MHLRKPNAQLHDNQPDTCPSTHWLLVLFHRLRMHIPYRQKLKETPSSSLRLEASRQAPEEFDDHRTNG